MRDAIQTRLATLDAPLRAYDTFDEQIHAPISVIVYPARWQWLTAPSCAVAYNFSLELWVDCQAGVARAQDTLDAYLSPTGTNDNSIEGKLEDRTIDDDLTTYTTSVKVDPFTSYGFGSLNGHDGMLVATVPVELYLDNS